MIEFNATFIVAMLSFAVFILIMNAIFYNPILNMMRTREEYINSNYEDSKKLEASAEEFKQTHAQKIKETQDKCRQEFKEHINEVQTIATSEIRNARENSKMEIQNRKDKLYEKESVLNKELKDTVAKNLAQEITKKLTGGITG
jgi:F0F1-type ATP synthase membrane subunit b/b'